MMTLSAALDTAARQFDDIAERLIAEFGGDLRERGATDDECAAMRVLQLTTLAPGRRRVLELVRAVWLTGHDVQ
jgi:hypothetical protein